MVAAPTSTDLFLAGTQRLADPGALWAARLREENRERFARAGLPAADDEGWRFTQLKPLRNAQFVFNPDAPREPGGGGLELGFPAFVLVNGRAQTEPLVGSGWHAESLASLLCREPGLLESRLGGLADTVRHRFAALNSAYLDDGVVVRVSAGALARVHLVISGPEASHAAYPRLLVVIEDGAEAVLVEEHMGADGFTCPVTEAYLGQGASLNHVRIDRSGEQGIHLGLVAVEQGRDSRYISNVVALGSRLLRLDLDVSLAALGAECVLNGLYVPVGKQHMDHHTRVSHEAPHTQSRELYKGVLGGKGSAVFNGRIVIREGSMGVDAAQTNNNLLLSNEALVNTNPELEIFADDVKAQHGATIGQLEEESLFYLRSRGLDLASARRMLIEAFAGVMIKKIGLESLEQYLEAELARRFQG
ncbi:MAG TPA: Fe-S cluster assembly protein SufD [Candidatus Eisenbacteria bacterium]|nr:Fe-S cluster assembly protein SufD [Candidatus Eisenbacteria bacterium]